MAISGTSVTVGTDPVQVGQSTEIMSSIVLQTKQNNSGTVTFGGPDVTEDDGTQLGAGREIEYSDVAPADIWMVGSAAGQVVRVQVKDMPAWERSRA